MLVTEICDDDPDGGEGILARVVKPHVGPAVGVGATFYGSPSDPQQVGVIRKDAGQDVPPHAHHYVRRTFDRTQEVLVVLSGWMIVDIYTSRGKPVRSVELWPGEVICLVAGGHGVRFPTGATFLEVKTGPYTGKDTDKYPLEVRSGSV